MEPPTCATLREGASIQRPGFGHDGKLTLGAIADTKEPLPDTLSTVKRFAERFAGERVDGVVLLGDLAADGEGVEAIVRAAAAPKVPIFVLPGDREPEGPFHDGLDRARASGIEVIDLQRTRIVDGEVDLVALPGYPFRSYLVDGGCRYRGSDLTALAERAAKLDGPTLLLGHTPPHGDGEGAIDRAFGAVNAGDPEINRMLDVGRIRFGLFAHVDEAGGRASDGKSAVAEGIASPTLLVNVGSADTVDNAPRAAIFALDHGRASFRVIQ
jgi:hypothetical protein